MKNENIFGKTEEEISLAFENARKERNRVIDMRKSGNFVIVKYADGRKDILSFEYFTGILCTCEYEYQEQNKADFTNIDANVSQIAKNGKVN